MSEAIHKGFYPAIPRDSNSFRLSSCSRAIDVVRDNLRLDTNKRDSASKRHSRMRFANGLSAASSAALSTSGVCVSASGVGAVVGAPLVGVGVLLGVASLVTLALDKEAVEKLTRYEKLVSLGRAKLSSMQDMTNKALLDESISDEEFRKMNLERTDYERQRTEILKSRKKEGLTGSRSLRSLTEELSKAIRESR